MKMWVCNVGFLRESWGVGDVRQEAAMSTP